MKWLSHHLLLLSLMSAPILADSGVEHASSGTIVFAKWFKDEIIIATDSRAKEDNGYRDDECKITTHNNTAVFSFSGLRHFDANKSFFWDAHFQARKAFEHADTRNGVGNKALIAATFWRDSAKNLFQFAFRHDPVGFRRALNSPIGHICDAIFAVRDDKGSVSMVTVSFDIKGTGEESSVEGEINHSFVEGGDVTMGHPSAMIEFFATPLSSRAQTAYANWQRSLPVGTTPIQKWESLCVQLVRWCIDFKENDEIGGDVNAAVLDSNGIRWLKQKDYCKAANQ